MFLYSNLAALFLIFSFLQLTYAHNILFFVMLAGKSHMDFFNSLVNVLIDRGHVVDVVIARMNPIFDITGFDRANRTFTYGFDLNNNPWSKASHLVDPFSKISRGPQDHNFFVHVSTQLCELGLSNKQLDEFLRKRKYDVALATEYDYCIASVLKYHGIPSVATINALPLLEMQSFSAGLPNSASEALLVFNAIDLSNIYGRLLNLYHWTHAYYIIQNEMADKHSEVVRKYYGNDYADVLRTQLDFDLIFVNSNELIERPRTISHKIKFIGGINLKTPKPLDEHFTRIVSDSSKGVILFCFGTQVPSDRYPLSVKRAFADTFRAFAEYTFIWKYEYQDEFDVELFSNITNLYVNKWIPQTDLLHNNKTVAFISHTGLNSYLEASYAGVPILAVPLFVDQPYNAISGESIGTTYIIDKTNITSENIQKGLDQLLNNQTYRENARRISKMLLEKPHKPKDEFVGWVEFIASNPLLHKQLNLPARHQTPVQYYCVDLIFICLVCIFISLFICKQLVKLLLRLFARSYCSVNCKVKVE